MSSVSTICRQATSIGNLIARGRGLSPWPDSLFLLQALDLLGQHLLLLLHGHLLLLCHLHLHGFLTAHGLLGDIRHRGQAYGNRRRWAGVGAASHASFALKRDNSVTTTSQGDFANISGANHTALPRSKEDGPSHWSSVCYRQSHPGPSKISPQAGRGTRRTQHVGRGEDGGGEDGTDGPATS